jgi:hypothetical protein
MGVHAPAAGAAGRGQPCGAKRMGFGDGYRPGCGAVRLRPVQAVAVAELRGVGAEPADAAGAGAGRVHCWSKHLFLRLDSVEAPCRACRAAANCQCRQSNCSGTRAVPRLACRRRQQECGRQYQSLGRRLTRESGGRCGRMVLRGQCNRPGVASLVGRGCAGAPRPACLHSRLRALPGRLFLPSSPSHASRIPTPAPARPGRAARS